MTVDEKRGPNGQYFSWSSRWTGAFSVEIMPGQHRITIGYYGAQKSRRDQACLFEALPGRHYSVTSVWEPVELVEGSETTFEVWHAWLVEEQTGTKVKCEATDIRSEWHLGM